MFNSFGLLADMTAFTQIKEGVARLLAGQEPAPVSSPSLPTRYLIVDAVLAALLALAVWPLLRLRRWEQRLRQQLPVGRWQLVRVGLRLAWEVSVPITLLFGVYLLLRATLGTLSWNEILLLFPDIGAWLWAISLIMLLTGAIRLGLLLRVLRRRDGERGMAIPAVQTRRRPT